jgi:ABC-2 type transport system ATP-binding protein
MAAVYLIGRYSRTMRPVRRAGETNVSEGSAETGRDHPDGDLGRGREAVVEAVMLRKSYGGRVALTGVSLEARPGELVACIGPNGAGKTTLLTVLAGIQRADSGEVRLRAKRTGWVPQQPALYGRLSVAENLRLFARLERVPDVGGTVDRMLAQAGLEAEAGVQVSLLSGGNRQRVNIAIGLIASPAVLFLDEPSSALDPRQRERLWSFVLDLARAGTTVVYSTHHVSEAERYADSVLVLADGERLFWGRPEELRETVAEEGHLLEGEDARRDFESAFVAFLHHRGH